MKKYLWLPVLFFLYVPVCARSAAPAEEQPRRNEISLAYGILPITGWMDSFVDLFTEGNTAVDDGASSYIHHISGWGAVSACYNFRINSKVSFGGMYVFAAIKEKMYVRKMPVVKSRTRFHTLMPILKFNWYTRPGVALYTRAGLGIVISAQKETGISGSGADRYRKNAYMAWQCSPVGVEAGRALSGFLELGIGNTGLLTAGLRYRF